MKKNIFHISLYLFTFLTAYFSNAQFPNPITLSTGQGTPGTQDPIWLCSPWSATIPGNPMGLTYGPTLINNNCAPGAWVDPASLTPPMNNGNWITGTEANCAANTAAGYRYFRLTLNLPPDCNGNSVTVQGSYILSLIGYVDNYIEDVFINGNSQGISGGGFSTGSQLNIYLDGPWVVGTNYVDILVFNAFTSPPGAQNPYGLLLVADGTNSANMDSDGDGVNDLDDLCPCDFGANVYGCPDPAANTCNIDLIRNTFLGAGCIELPLCYSDCSMYFLNPDPNSGSSAQAFAQMYGANLISVQDAAENQCILDELTRIGETGVIWIGFNDEAQEGNFVWYDQAPITYTNWAANEPNNAAGNENCTQILPNGTWNDLNCNTANAKSIIEVNLCPVISTPDVIVCTNETTVIAADNPILGSHPYTFSWDNGATTQSQTVPTTNASYIVTVTDRYNCSGTDTATVTTKAVPVVSVSPNDTLICSGEQTAFNITSTISGTTFVWTAAPANVNGSANGTGNNITQTLSTVTSSNGTVNYTITPSYDGCTGTPANATITVSAIPELVFSPASATICEGETQPISVSGASTYSWSPNTGLNTVVGATVTASPTSTQTYTVVGTNSDGCEGNGNFVLTVNSLPTATISGTSTVCQGDAAQTITFTGANGTSDYAFTYSLNGGASQTITTSGGNSATITVPTTNSGTFSYVLQGVEDVTTGCEQTQAGTATVIVNPMPDAVITGTVVVCQNDAAPVITFSGTNSSDEYTFTYSLNGGATQTVTTNGANTATVTVPTNVVGTFTYELINVSDPATSCNQDVNQTQTVTVNPLPTATISGTSTVCQGDAAQTITFTGANGTSDYEFTYSLNGGAPQTITTSGGNSVTITVPTTTPGTFTYVLQGVENGVTGCGQSQTGTVTVIVNPIIYLTDNIQVCNYDLPYLWNGQTITSGGNGIATHTTQDANGCNVITTLNLTVTSPPNVSFSVAADECLPSQVVMIPSSVVPNGNCTWYVNGQQISGDCSGANFTESDSGCQTVELVAVDANGCITTVTINDAYCIAPAPDALFQLSQSSNITSQTINQSTNASSYLWVLPNGTTTTELNPLILFEQLSVESIVTLYAYSSIGCSDSMSLVIDWPFVVPNVVTANGDGVNDYFIIAGLAPDSKLTVLNRWGNIVYTSGNYNNTWDGRDARGNYVAEGVYSYVLELQNGTKQHGFIHIER